MKTHRETITVGNSAVIINRQDDHVWANLYVNARGGIQDADITNIDWKGKTVEGARRWAKKQLNRTGGLTHAVVDSGNRIVGRSKSRVAAHRVTRRANRAGTSVGVNWALSPSDLRPGLQIASIAHPDWGVWTVDRKYDEGIWEIHSNDRGKGHSTTLFEGELRFWRRIGLKMAGQVKTVAKYRLMIDHTGFDQGVMSSLKEARAHRAFLFRKYGFLARIEKIQVPEEKRAS